MRYLPLLLAPLALAACNQATPGDATASATPSAPATLATTNATVEPVPTAAASPASSASKRTMAGTSTPLPGNAPPSSCGADKAAKFVGKIATPDVRAQTIEAVGHHRIRWIDPDTVVTMDYSESRLNMIVDAANRITATRCG